MRGKWMQVLPRRERIVAFLVVFGLVGGSLYLGGSVAWTGYAARQGRIAAETERKAAFEAVFKPCFDRLSKRQLDEQIHLRERRSAHLLDNIGNPHARKRQELRDAIQDSYMEERHEREYDDCMERERLEQGHARESAR